MPFCHHPIIAYPQRARDCFLPCDDPGRWIISESPTEYKPRRPERTAFYQLFQDHFLMSQTPYASILKTFQALFDRKDVRPDR